MRTAKVRVKRELVQAENAAREKPASGVKKRRIERDDFERTAAARTASVRTESAAVKGKRPPGAGADASAGSVETESVLSVRSASKREAGRERFTLIMIGPPGSGKGTQASQLAARYGVPQISTGDLLRDPRTKRTAAGREAQKIMAEGKLVPDALMMRIVAARLAKPDAKHGFILDGFPRTLEQAKQLDALLEKSGRTLAHVMFIDVPDDVAVARILGRSAQAAASGGTVRADDNEKTAQVRLGTYHAQTEDALAYYRDRGVVRHLDGQKDIEAIFKDLTALVGRRKRNPAS